MISEKQNDKVFQGGVINQFCIMLSAGQVKWILRIDQRLSSFQSHW